ncbi:YhcU family protein [Bacillus massilinigeriensis]|uniref:YhcU family protein n=1 Tax=Bacillus massilionigeriensis TaxID=1805475 RepID=UPI00096B54A1|nr:YhcU family protein [Bacillus massilionigeriensis]
MKVVYASTPDQERKVEELVQEFYTSIFPIYFSDEDIKEFERLNVLQTSTRHFEYFGTLKEAFQVIASLQTIKFILLSSEPKDKYETLYSKNIQILTDFGLSFPFEFQQFLESRNMKNGVFSIYTKAANELLI